MLHPPFEQESEKQIYISIHGETYAHAMTKLTLIEVWFCEAGNENLSGKDERIYVTISQLYDSKS